MKKASAKLAFFMASPIREPAYPCVTYTRAGMAVA